MDIKINITADVVIKIRNKEVLFSISPKENSMIAKYKFLNDEDMPEDFSEIDGFERIDKHNEVATIKEVLLVSHAIIPQMFLLSIGKPLLFQCTRNLASYSEKIYKNKFNTTILRGSLRIDSPYEPLVAYYGPFLRGNEEPYDEDSHIVMLSRM